MEARQSSPLCAQIGLLLLLTGLICSHLPEAQGGPMDFWCNKKNRNHMLDTTMELKKYMNDCVRSLPSPIQLPCVGVRKQQWQNKTVQQKSDEVMRALQVFQEGVQNAKGHIASQTSPSECQSVFLDRLKKRINNYIGIVNFVHNQNGASESALDFFTHVSTLDKVLDGFVTLLSGKLERLASDLQPMCTRDHRTANDNGS